MRSVRTFVISLVIALVVLGVLAYIIASSFFDIRFEAPKVDDNVNASDDELDEPSTPPDNDSLDIDLTDKDSDADNDVSPHKITESTFLFIGTDYQPETLNYDTSGYDGNGFYIKKRKVSADAIILMKIDSESKTFMFTSIPPNTVMNKTTNKTIGEYYSEKGPAFMIECVYALTGIQAEHLAVIGIEDCVKMLEEVGDIMYSVPCDMNYVDESQNLEIDLKAGLQKLTPKQAVDMLRFKDYEKKTNLTRESVMVDFVRAMMQKLTSPANLDKAATLFKDVVDLFETDFDLTDFTDHIDLIFSYQEYNTRVIKYPGYNKELTGKILYFPSLTEALGSFKEYK